MVRVSFPSTSGTVSKYGGVVPLNDGIDQELGCISIDLLLNGVKGIDTNKENLLRLLVKGIIKRILILPYPILPQHLPTSDISHHNHLRYFYCLIAVGQSNTLSLSLEYPRSHSCSSLLLAAF